MKLCNHFVLLLAIVALGASPAKPTVGFINLPRLIELHPLHAVLAQYDREIASLRATQTLPGLRNPTQTALNAGSAQQRESSSARAAVAAIDARNAANDRARERNAVAALRASRNAGQAAMSQYTTTLERETEVSFAAFGRATAQRSARAYAARAQQLGEKESTLAFDLERQDAGKRLALRVRLEDLHLSVSERTNLRAQLDALDARELQAISAQRRRDAATLAAYRDQLAGAGATANARMAAQLRAKASANLSIRQTVSVSASNASGGADLTQRLDSFSAGYAGGTDARAIDSAMREASGDLSRRFAALAAADRQSEREVAAQLRGLQADRSALYRSMITQILRTAALVARQHGLAGIDFAGRRPQGSRDLTEAVRKALI